MQAANAQLSRSCMPRQQSVPLRVLVRLIAVPYERILPCKGKKHVFVWLIGQQASIPSGLTPTMGTHVSSDRTLTLELEQLHLPAPDSFFVCGSCVLSQCITEA
jgi:hypothetical protein